MGLSLRNRPGMRWVGLLGLVFVLGGCAFEQSPGTVGALVMIPAAVPVPAGSAHASFQGGRLVSGTNRLDPYCELEIKTVSEAAQEAQPGRYRVVWERFTLLRDPTTRLPALFTGISCYDPLFQESVWRLAGEGGGNLHSLRCVRPLYHCAFAPALGLVEIGDITGPAVQTLGPEG